MVDERETTPADGNPTVNPLPVEPPTAFIPPAPLAPPLVASPAPPTYGASPPYAAPSAQGAAPPYAAPSAPGAAPPYYQQQAQQHPAPQYHHPAPPYQPAPHSPRSGGKIAAIVIGSIAAFVLIMVLVFVGAFLAIGSIDSGNDSAPDSGVVTPDEPSEPEAPGTSDPPDTTANDSIAVELDAKVAEYKLARDNGSLWEKIPDTEYNRTAVSAFLYLLADMKAATIWGVDESLALEYADRMTHLEELLLSEQPLGSDIQITLSDRVFRYDGDTGEGGYSDE